MVHLHHLHVVFGAKYLRRGFDEVQEQIDAKRVVTALDHRDFRSGCIHDGLFFRRQTGGADHVWYALLCGLRNAQRHGGVEREVNHGLCAFRPLAREAIRHVDFRDDLEVLALARKLYEHSTHAPCGADYCDFHVVSFSFFTVRTWA